MILTSRNTLPVLLLSFSPLLLGTLVLARQVTPQEIQTAGASHPQMAPVFFQSPLSSYRGFQFGMSVSAAVKHSGMDPSEVVTARVSSKRWTGLRSALFAIPSSLTRLSVSILLSLMGNYPGPLLITIATRPEA